MESLRNSQKEILEINKKVFTEIKHGLINRLDTGEERMSELEDMSLEASQTEMKNIHT